MGKKIVKKSVNPILHIATILLIPLSIYWILVRKGFAELIDALAMGVVIGFFALLGVRWIAKQKIISFGK